MKSVLMPRLAAILLLGLSGSLIAGELPFNVPDTPRAQETAQLLHRAAQALFDATSAGGSDANQVVDLWLFPTADASTVFASYRVIPTQRGSSSTAHLALLTLDGESIVQVRELADSRSDPQLLKCRAPGGVNGPSIGTGHAASSEVTADFRGAPAPPHWTALIGTGHVSGPASAAASESPSSSHTRPSTAGRDWTSRIGTGRAAESNDGFRPSQKAAAAVRSASVAVVAAPGMTE
jgi:hypothetical protein